MSPFSKFSFFPRSLLATPFRSGARRATRRTESLTENFPALQAGSSFPYRHTSARDDSPLGSSCPDAMASSRFALLLPSLAEPAASPARLSRPTSTPARDTRLRCFRPPLRPPALALVPVHIVRSAP